MKKLIVFLAAFSLVLTGCGQVQEEPVVEEDPFANITPPVVQESYLDFDLEVPSIQSESKDVKDKAKYENITTSGYVRYEDCTTILTDTNEYYTKDLTTAKLLFECATHCIPTMVKVSRSNKVLKWYAVVQNAWYIPESSDDVINLYKYILGDASDDNYPKDIGTTGKIGGNVMGYTDGVLDVLVNGEHKYILANDEGFVKDSFIEKDIVVVTGGAIATSDYKEPETVVDAIPLEYQCPIGYSKIKPLEYRATSDTSDVKTLDIKGGGQYTTDSWEVAEVITLAYYSGIDVYVKTGDNLFQIDDFILVADKQELDIRTSEELMNYVNAKSIPKSKAKPTTKRLTAKLLTVTPSINLYSGVSDLDALDKRPFYSYHYAVLRDVKYNTYIMRYTSGTKGIDYLKWSKRKNKTVKCTYTCFILQDSDGKHTNYVLDEVR